MGDKRKCYFVVTRGQLGETPAIYWDELPQRVPVKNLVYCVPLDRLPLGDKYPLATLEDLFDVYRTLRDRGALPQSE